MSIVPGNLPLCTHRYAMFVSYLGTKYLGSQRQIAREDSGIQNTIQEAIEWSLEFFLPLKRCKLTGASRTDRGVHALMNCFTLPLMDFDLPTEKMKRLANHNLMRMHHDIAVNEVILAPANFHPRKCAVSREYIYRLAVMSDNKRLKATNQHKPSDLLHLLPITEQYKILPLPCFDIDKAMSVIEMLQGEHDFASFSGVQEWSTTDTVRDLEINLLPGQMTTIDPREDSPFTIYHLHLKSRAFLYNQVRRIVGSIVSYATYNSVELKDIQFLLENPDNKKWNPQMLLADPWGLFLSRINYDKSAFSGTIKTYEDNTEENFDYAKLIDSNGEKSDDRPKVVVDNEFQ